MTNAQNPTLNRAPFVATHPDGFPLSAAQVANVEDGMSIVDWVRVPDGVGGFDWEAVYAIAYVEPVAHPAYVGKVSSRGVSGGPPSIDAVLQSFRLSRALGFSEITEANLEELSFPALMGSPDDGPITFAGPEPYDAGDGPVAAHLLLPGVELSTELSTFAVMRRDRHHAAAALLPAALPAALPSPVARRRQFAFDTGLVVLILILAHAAAN